MAITSNRSIVVTFGSPYASNWTFNAAQNTNAPTSVQTLTLVATNNVIAVPTGGTVVQGATIIPPSGNTNSLTLKGTNADTGVVLHKTDPTSIALDTTQSSIVLTVASTITGVRIIWT